MMDDFDYQEALDTDVHVHKGIGAAGGVDVMICRSNLTVIAELNGGDLAVLMTALHHRVQRVCLFVGEVEFFLDAESFEPSDAEVAIGVTPEHVLFGVARQGESDVLWAFLPGSELMRLFNEGCPSVHRIASERSSAPPSKCN